jgi:hypothetical protein
LSNGRFYPNDEVVQQGDVAQVEGNDVMNDSRPLIGQAIGIGGYLL